MKKRLFVAVAMLLAVMLLATAVSAENTDILPQTKFRAAYSAPVIDGVVSEGEWDPETRFVLDSFDAYAWIGEIGTTRVETYYAWQKNGLFVCMNVHDETVNYDAGKSAYFTDCVQLYFNPGGLIPDGMDGIVLSFHVRKNDTVACERHNYDAGELTSDDIIAAGYRSDSGMDYVCEAFIPWDVLRVSDPFDTTAFDPAERDTIPFMLAYLNRPGNGNGLLSAFKSSSVAGSFKTDDFDGEILLMPKSGTTPGHIVDTGDKMILCVALFAFSSVALLTAYGCLRRRRRNDNEK